MGNLTKNKPKSFVQINKEKKLIDKVIENFKKQGFNKIYIITGYKSNKFQQFKEVIKIKNYNWKTTNIFGSLLLADKILSKMFVLFLMLIFITKKKLSVYLIKLKRNCNIEL